MYCVVALSGKYLTNSGVWSELLRTGVVSVWRMMIASVYTRISNFVTGFSSCRPICMLEAILSYRAPLITLPNRT